MNEHVLHYLPPVSFSMEGLCTVTAAIQSKLWLWLLGLVFFFAMKVCLNLFLYEMELNLKCKNVYNAG
ncbi:hypothetical protein CsatB_001929 [Cannabis sativa]